MIEAGAYRALQDLAAVAPYVPASPVTISVEVDKIEKMEEFRGRAGVELIVRRRKFIVGLKIG